MPAFTNTFGGTNIYAADVSYRAVSLTANTTLAWPTEMATDTNVVSSIMDVTATAGSLTIRMPPANQVSVGQTVLFFNVGSFSFTVADNSGNTIQTIAAGQAWQLYLTDNTTVNGSWRQIQYGVGTSSPSAAALAGAGLKAITTTLNQSAPITLLSVNYTLTSVDRARVLVWDGGAGTFTLPSAVTAGNDWFFDARNSGAGGLTITPAGGELINGQASLVFNPGDSARIITDGVNFYTIGYGQGSTFSFDYVSINLTGETSPYTLSGTNLNRIAYQFSGPLTANMEVIVPSTLQQYWVRNTTTGSYTLTVKTAAGTGVTVVQNGASILYCDGTNVVQAETASLSVPVSVSQGGTGATTSGTALVNLGGTSLGINLFTATNPAVARAALGAAAAGVNSDITELTGLTTALSVPQGGTGQSSYTDGQLLIGNSSGNTLTKATLTAGTGITVTNGNGSITIAGTGPDTFPSAGIVYSNGTGWGASYGTSGTGTTVALTNSPAFLGTPTAPTALAGTSTTQIATTAFVAATAFSSVLPGQTGNAGKFITTDGTNASWAYVPVGSISATGSVTAGHYLSGAGTWDAINSTTILPSQAGKAGEFLTTDGSNVSWTPIPAQVYPGAGVAVSTGSAWGTSKTAPSGDLVGTTDTQTLSAKTLTDPVIKLSGSDGNAGQFVIGQGAGQPPIWTTINFSSISYVPYANRAQLRTTDGPASTLFLVESLGLFAWISGSTAVDDDETCFATASGRWLLQTISWNFADAQIDNWRQVISAQAPVLISSVSALSSVQQYVQVIGAQIGNAVSVSPPAQLGGQLSVYAFVSSPNIVAIITSNPHATVAKSIPSGNWTVSVFS